MCGSRGGIEPRCLIKAQISTHAKLCFWIGEGRRRVSRVVWSCCRRQQVRGFPTWEFPIIWNSVAGRYLNIISGRLWFRWFQFDELYLMKFHNCFGMWFRIFRSSWVGNWRDMVFELWIAMKLEEKSGFSWKAIYKCYGYIINSWIPLKMHYLLILRIYSHF